MATAAEQRSVEEQARRFLRLFPAWVRATRGEEAVSLVLDLLPPDSARLPVRARVDLVRAGLQQRRREIPPPSVWWTAHAATLRSSHGWVPARWHPWLLHLARPAWCRVRFVARLWGALATVAVAVALVGGGRDALPGTALISAMAWAFVLSTLGEWRRSVLERNGYGPDGLPLPPDRLRQRTIAASLPNMPLRQLAAWLAGSVGLASLIALVLMVWWPQPGVGGAEHLRAGLAGAAVAVIGVAIMGRLASRIGGEPSEGPPPALTWSGRGAWQVWVLLVSATLLVVMIAHESELGALLVVCSNALAVAAFATVRRTEHRIARPLGLWDVFPYSAERTVWTCEPPPPNWRPPSPGPPTPS